MVFGWIKFSSFSLCRPLTLEKRVTTNTTTKRYSRVLIAGGIGTEKKDPVRSTKIINKKRIELTIAKLEANLTLALFKRRPIDARSIARPAKMLTIAIYPKVFKADCGRVSKPSGVKRIIIMTLTIITVASMMTFLFRTIFSTRFPSLAIFHLRVAPYIEFAYSQGALIICKSTPKFLLSMPL